MKNLKISFFLSFFLLSICLKGSEPSNTSYFPFDSDIVVMAAIMNVESPDRRTQNLRDRLNPLEYYSERESLETFIGSINTTFC